MTHPQLISVEKEVSSSCPDAAYKDLCLTIANNLFRTYPSIDAIRQNEYRINAYANLDTLGPPKDIHILQEEPALSIRKIKAAKCILEGKLFMEHAAAGEATRLGMGTKYLIDIRNQLGMDTLAEQMSAAAGRTVSKKEIIEKAGGSTEDLLPLSLGVRHMLQLSYDIYHMALRFHANPETILENQKMLIIINAHSADTIIREMMACRYFGFSRENVMFMIQKAYPGISFRNGIAFFDPSSPERLHNHGYIALQQTMDDQIFYMDEFKRRCHLKADEFGNLLGMMNARIHSSIESLTYLTESIDFESLGFSLEEGDRGARMVMEIVKNDPENPQKGGMAAYDTRRGKNVMIEGFQLKNLPNEKITYLNKNFNYFPRPFDAWNRVKRFGIGMPVSVKKDHLYFQPVQGDMNFMLNTSFFQRENVTPIEAWKSISNTPIAIRAMLRQDRQDGFREYAESLIGKRL